MYYPTLQVNFINRLFTSGQFRCLVTLFPLASLFSLPHHKALFISPCLLHVDMENILGGNSNDSYIHRLSLDSVFVFKLHFLPNRVYKPCLGRGDHSLQYSLESDTLGYISFWSCRISMWFGAFCGLRLADIGGGSLASHWVFRRCHQLYY